jgi:steroid Delta-isomerase
VSDLALKKLINYFQTLTPASVVRMDEVYMPDAHFRDPFNEVRDIESLKRIFNEMFVRLHDPHFVIIETIAEENGAVLIWDFTFRMKSLQPAMPRRIHGLSHVRFAADGRVNYHRDYWDAAGELYERLPIVGSLMRWLKSRAK